MKLLHAFKIFTFAAVLFLSAARLQPAQAQLMPQAWTTNYCTVTVNAPNADGTTSEVQVATIQGLQCLFANVFAVFIPIIGFMAFVMLVWGATRYMLSGGNPKNVESARNTIKFAILGIIVALSAFFFMQILANITGVNRLKEFKIPDSDFTNDL